MRFIFVLLIFLNFPSFCWAQSLSTPSDTQQKLSSLGYSVSKEIGSFTGDAEERKILNAFYQPDGEGHVVMYETQNLPSPWERKAKAAIEAGNCKKGVKYFEKGSSSEKASQLKVTFDYCTCLKSTGKRANAIPVLKEFLEEHFYNYEIHRRLASIYFENKEFVLAKHHSSLAVLLNRNHPLIQKEWEKIHSSDGIKRTMIHWNPKEETTISGKKIIVRAENEAWAAFGACTALWQLDDAHVKLTLLKASKHPLEIQAHECLYNAFIARIPNARKDELLDLADRCLKEKCLDEFIFTHIVLAQDPFLSYLESEETLNHLANFLSKY